MRKMLWGWQSNYKYMKIDPYTRKQNVLKYTKMYDDNLKVLFSIFKHMRVFPSLKSLQIIFFFSIKKPQRLPNAVFFYFGFKSIILRNSQRIYKAALVKCLQKIVNE